MGTSELLDSYDEQIRRHPEASGGSVVVERDRTVVRVVAADDGWVGVTSSDLTAPSADEVIAAQVRRFAELDPPVDWEWKHFSHDQPADLPDRLQRAGLTPGPPEALLIARVSDLDLNAQPPVGVHVTAVEEQHGIDALVAVHDAVFGGDHARTGAALAAQLGRVPSAVAAVLAVADGSAVSSGRVEFHHGTDFASLWGGGTVPQWRGRGVFRALVSYRAALAADAGFRYLHVDASAESRPILRRLGFVEVATTTPFHHRAGG